MHFETTSLLAFLALSRATAAGGICTQEARKSSSPSTNCRTGSRPTISDQWADFGVTFSGFRRLNKKSSNSDVEPALRLFDSTRPTGDHDLGSPNEGCDNPNVKCPGVAKQKPQNAASTNCKKQNKVVIDPNDFRLGGEVESNSRFLCIYCQLLRIARKSRQEITDPQIPSAMMLGQVPNRRDQTSSRRRVTYIARGTSA